MGMLSAARKLQDRMECLRGGKEGMSSEQKNESQIEKERGVCRVQSHRCGGGVKGEQGNEWEEGEQGASDSPEYSRSPVISSHPLAKLQIYAVQTHTHSVRTPLANYPPATAFAIQWPGLTHHRYEPVFDVSCSVCVS